MYYIFFDFPTDRIGEMTEALNPPAGLAAIGRSRYVPSEMHG
jgi:hypothetical protein